MVTGPTSVFFLFLIFFLLIGRVTEMPAVVSRHTFYIFANHLMHSKKQRTIFSYGTSVILCLLAILYHRISRIAYAPCTYITILFFSISILFLRFNFWITSKSVFALHFFLSLYNNNNNNDNKTVTIITMCSI